MREELLLETIKEALLRDGRWEGEFVNTTRNNERVIVASRWALQRDAHGRPVGTLETNNDITERRRAEDLVQRSQAAYLAEAQKLSRTGSFGWNATNGDIFWSDESFRIFGYEPAAKPSIDLILQRIHPEDVAAVRQALDRAASSKRDFDIEHRLRMPDGTIKFLHIVARLLAGEPGRLQFAGAVIDMTAARQAEERLQRAQSELAYSTRVTTLGELTASIAHEVNQPLAAIIANGEAALRWLGRPVPQLDEVSDSLQHMIADGKRASDIVQRIRALVKKSDEQRLPIDLNEVIDDIVPLIRREVSSHRVLLRVEHAAPLPLVLGDRVQLQQVIINLAINGIQAMAMVDDRARELVIRSEENPAGQVVVSVRDSGTGIKLDSSSRMFDAFFTTKPGGMGMGLAVCRTIIEAHGGRVWADVANGAPGAMFRFCLPAMRSEDVLKRDTLSRDRFPAAFAGCREPV
jgi:PAS domain S-box-containing protein